MSSICDKKDCTGCLACMNICAHGAIEKIYDEEGFISVNINYEKCVKCGLCKKVCPQLSSYKNINFKKIYYAAYSNNIDKLMSSTSGAIFQEIVDSMYKKFKKFIVVGAVLENNNVKHVAYEDYNEYYKLYGSKYVQSDIDNIYKYVKKKLEEDYYVLFSGTPCQIHALNKFLMKKYTKLYTVDLICHGVSNGILFSKYINFLEDKYRGKVTNYNFRTKDKKTWEHMCSFNINNKKVYIKGSLDPYLYNFLKGTILRESCYQCKYANLNRVGDITLGDFWGIEKSYPEFSNNLGNSLIIINTPNGKDIFDLINKKLKFIEVREEEATEYNNTLRYPTIRPQNRDYSFENIFNKNFSSIIKENLKYKKSLIRFLKAYFPYEIKKKIKLLKKM